MEESGSAGSLPAFLFLCFEVKEEKREVEKEKRKNAKKEKIQKNTKNAGRLPALQKKRERVCELYERFIKEIIAYAYET